MGAMRWLLGADARVDGETGAVKHGSIVRWRYLIAHKPTNGFPAWHATRGYDVPQTRSGHERERAFLRQQREQRHARI
jgi:hypothetical protein